MVDIKRECYSCEHKREVAGNCHIRCNNPDPEMQGNSYGVKKGWFIYPILFDPVWKEKACNNFKKVEAISEVISHSVSPE